MKKVFYLLVLIAVCAAGSGSAADEVAFIDLQEVFRQFYKTQLAQDQMRQQADDIKMERDTIGKELDAMKEEIDALRTDARDEALSEEVRENKRNQLEEKLVEMQQKEQDLADFEKLRKEQLEQQNTRQTKKLFDEIQDAIIRYSKAQGFVTVIDRSAKSRVGTSVFVYTNPKYDITAEVLAVLNEGREVKPVAAPVEAVDVIEE